MGWKLERLPRNTWEWRSLARVPYLYPVRWEYVSYFSSHGCVVGHTLTKRGAEKRLLEAERWLLSS